jgi:ribA/ribD-fused uncharacterized protein
MIKEFQGEYRWLSNFAPCKIILNGVEYKSVEHAYISEKSDDPEWKQFCVTTESPGELKKASRSIQLVVNWDTIKVDVMKTCIDQKFNQSPYKQKLIGTGNEHIQEGNMWGDTFWGVSLKTGKGQNVLGTLLMEKRRNLTNASD